MKRLLLSSLVLFSVTPLQAVKSLRQHIVSTVLYALKNPETTEVSVERNKLVFFDKQGDLTELSVKKIHRAINKTINKNQRRKTKNNNRKGKIERFKTGSDLQKLDLAESLKEQMIQERTTALNALRENNRDKLLSACEQLQVLEKEWFVDSEDD